MVCVDDLLIVYRRMNSGDGIVFYVKGFVEYLNYWYDVVSSIGVVRYYGLFWV